MKRIVSLLMALVLATGVCVFISSCGAEKSLVQSSEIGESWNDFVYGDKTKAYNAWLTDPALKLAMSIPLKFNDNAEDISKTLAVLKDVEKHVIEVLDYTGHAYYSESMLLHGTGEVTLASSPNMDLLDGKMQLIITFKDDVVCVHFCRYADELEEIYVYFKTDVDTKEFIDRLKEYKS